MLQVELEGGAVGRLGEPAVQVAGFPGLEEEHVVAVVQRGELVELVQLRLGVELGLPPAVREEGVQVVEQLLVSVRTVDRVNGVHIGVVAGGACL